MPFRDHPGSSGDPSSALDREGALLKVAARIAHIGAWEYDVVAGVLHWSAEAAAIHGLGPDDEPDLARVIDFYDETSRPVIAAAFQAALRDGTPFDLQLGFIANFGQRRWVRVLGSAERDGTGRVMRLAGLFQDVTTEREAQLAITVLSERLRLATDVAGVGVWDWDFVSWRIHWSPRMYRLHGLPEDGTSIDNARWTARIHPDDQALCSAGVRAASRKGQAYDTEHRVVWPDGTVRWVHTVGRMLESGDQGRRMIGTCVDVTDRRRHAEAQLEKAAAEEANRAKSEFLSRVSHELRTPLNGILGFAQLLQRGALAPPEQRQVQLIRDAGEHLLQIVNDMLDLAAIEAEQLRLSLEPLALLELARASVELVRPLAESRRVSIELSAGQGATHVRGDRVRLRQVLVNLLSNAVKYNREGGQAAIRWRATGHGEVEIEVADTGPGLAPAQLAAMFQPFNRLGAEGSDVEGSGLGLAITQRLVQAMGATIEVDSALGQGCRMRLRLPVAEAPRVPLGIPSAPLPRPVPATAPRQLLYVEDNPINVLLMEQALALHGSAYALTVATDGEQALARLAGERPDLLMLDLNLPGLGGYEVLAQVRAAPHLAGLPCVAVSADAMPDEVARAHEAGFDGYWTKPLDIGRLAERIESLLARRTG